MSLIMDVLEKPNPGAAVSPGDSQPFPKITPSPRKPDPQAQALKSFFESPAPGTVQKHRHPGSSGLAFQVKSPGKRVIVISLVLLAAALAGSAMWYFFSGLNASRSSAGHSASAAVSKPVKPSTHFSWSTPKSSGTASVSKAASIGTVEPAVLQGVILDGVEPLCLIEGNILKIGDVWEGKKITAITGLGVSLADKQGNASFIAITK